ncbi:hypothetical protein K432DRAFT_406012 [Lepidopterella palustris CBS 459.81]|uniref:PiggyBac transposable element-derived protein domain-containing protein n=1 Tax=Lepidopterella palustris CBS 459.81 TaxID=1314670 RepID=A0A8E2E848_9PEZI|nr:hypothetical protein K432DRAFT_406012 [Lepidopterella palustris CBS 459.81]
MPRTFTNDINVVQYTQYKVPPTPQPWPLPAFTPMEIDDYNGQGEPNVPPSLDQHDPTVLFLLFFTDEILDNRVDWTDEYAESHPPTDDKHTSRKILQLEANRQKRAILLSRRYWTLGPHLAVDKTIERFVAGALEIVNIPTKPTPKGVKIWVLANQGYVPD